MNQGHIFRFAITCGILVVAASTITAQFGWVHINRRGPTNAHFVDVNNASMEELLNELVIDKELAHRMISGRPYTHKTELREREIVDADTYKRIEGRITAKDTRVR